MTIAFVACARRSAALDKQGSAHGGSVEGRDTGFDVSGSLLLGSAIINPTYAARPDNTGLALFRYATHVETVFEKHFAFGVDSTFFSDRTTKNFVGPSELDLTVELILREHAVGFHLAYERDMPVDRGGLVQQFLYFTVGVAIDKDLNKHVEHH